MPALVHRAQEASHAASKGSRPGILNIAVRWPIADRCSVECVLALADWYPDPFGRYERRYWNGSEWTEHVATQTWQGVDAPVQAQLRQVVANPEYLAGWYPDPFGRHETRYWDGVKWTDHVASGGRQGVDPVEPAAPVAIPRASSTSIQTQPFAGQPLPAGRVALPTTSRDASKIQKQVQKVGSAAATGAPDLAILSEPILVINQKGKLVELRAEYAVYDQNGRQLAAVRGRRLSSRIQVVDMVGRPLLELRRDASLISSKVNVTGVNGAKVGRIVPSMHINKIDRDFKLEGPHNELIGAVHREDHLRKRHREFRIEDAAGHLIADISKTRAGLAKELFTKGDNYVVSFPGSPRDPLRWLSIASALVIDTRYHQR